MLGIRAPASAQQNRHRRSLTNLFGGILDWKLISRTGKLGMEFRLAIARSDGRCVAPLPTGAICDMPAEEVVQTGGTGNTHALCEKCRLAIYGHTPEERKSIAQKRQGRLL